MKLLFEIDLKPFNIDLFYDHICDIVCHEQGWINHEKAIFHSIEQRDHCLLKLEETFRVQGSEVKNLKNIAKLLYRILMQDLQNQNFSIEN